MPQGNNMGNVAIPLLAACCSGIATFWLLRNNHSAQQFMQQPGQQIGQAASQVGGVFNPQQS
ncbi:hypothetical protein EWH99_05470 [Sporolactobacillus sp. THM7-7]|nr:hypothetical protein EWH99_05470 [Sporolactobacillus sp. THM7-7]